MSRLVAPGFNLGLIFFSSIITIPSAFSQGFAPPSPQQILVMAESNVEQMDIACPGQQIGARYRRLFQENSFEEMRRCAEEPQGPPPQEFFSRQEAASASFTQASCAEKLSLIEKEHNQMQAVRGFACAEFEKTGERTSMARVRQFMTENQIAPVVPLPMLAAGDPMLNAAAIRAGALNAECQAEQVGTRYHELFSSRPISEMMQCAEPPSPEMHRQMAALQTTLEENFKNATCAEKISLIEAQAAQMDQIRSFACGQFRLTSRRLSSAEVEAFTRERNFVPVLPLPMLPNLPRRMPATVTPGMGQLPLLAPAQ